MVKCLRGGSSLRFFVRNRALPTVLVFIVDTVSIFFNSASVMTQTVAKMWGARFDQFSLADFSTLPKFSQMKMVSSNSWNQLQKSLQLRTLPTLQQLLLSLSDKHFLLTVIAHLLNTKLTQEFAQFASCTIHPWPQWSNTGVLNTNTHVKNSQMDIWNNFCSKEATYRCIREKDPVFAFHKCFSHVKIFP